MYRVEFNGPKYMITSNDEGTAIAPHGANVEETKFLPYGEENDAFFADLDVIAGVHTDTEAAPGEPTLDGVAYTEAVEQFLDEGLFA